MEYAQQVNQESLDSVGMVEALEKQRSTGLVQKGLFQAEKGVVLKFKKFPARLVVESTRKLTEPKVPRMYIESKDREEENPNDPQYLLDKQAYNMALVDTLTRVNLGFGTEIVDLGGCPGPETTEWAEDLVDMVGLKIADGGKIRYVAWLQFFVLTDVELQELSSALLEFNTGVRMEDVVAAEASFPGVSEGPADTASPSESAQGDDTHQGNGTTGDGAGVRVEGSSEVRPDSVESVSGPTIRREGIAGSPLPNTLSD